MGKVKKVLMWIVGSFIALMVLSVVVATLVPSPNKTEPPKKVVEVQKPKPKAVKKVEKPKPVVKKPVAKKPKVKEVVKKKTEALKLEEIGHKQGQFLITQCYATNQSGKMWKGYAQVSILDTKGKVLHYSYDHCWTVELSPGERDYRVAKIPLPKQRPFVVEWEWWRQKLLITYH